MEDYTRTIKLLAEHVDSKQNLRVSTLLHFAQEMAIAHTEALGMGRKMTLDRGFLWIICKERFVIHRMPKYDEEITLISSPGKTLHFFFPRRFKILDKQGNVLVEGNAIWALIDEKTRGFIDPSEQGIHIEGEDCKDDLNMMMVIKPAEKQRNVYLKATYSKADLNGHLNNAYYLDFAQDQIPLSYLVEHDVKEIQLMFKKEIKLGQKVKVNISENEDDFNFISKSFSLKLRY